MSKGLLSSIEKVCEEWAKSLPVLTAPEAKCDLSLFAAKNARRKMEDRHALCVDVNSLFGLKVSVFFCLGEMLGHSAGYIHVSIQKRH